MHELSLAKRVVREAEAIARDRGAGRVVALTLRAGSLRPVNAGVLVEHFARAARGTVAEGARIEVLNDDQAAPPSPELTIESVELEVD